MCTAFLYFFCLFAFSFFTYFEFPLVLYYWFALLWLQITRLIQQTFFFLVHSVLFGLGFSLSLTFYVNILQRLKNDVCMIPFFSFSSLGIDTAAIAIALLLLMMMGINIKPSNNIWVHFLLLTLLFLYSKCIFCHLALRIRIKLDKNRMMSVSQFVLVTEDIIQMFKHHTSSVYLWLSSSIVYTRHAMVLQEQLLNANRFLSRS